MNPAAKLVGFALLLAAVFGAAALAGAAFGPSPAPESREAPHGASEHTGAEPHAAAGPHDGAERAVGARGLAVADPGLRLDLRTPRLERGRPARLRFAVLGAGDEAVTDFEVEHERRMHLIVVRRDGRGFQHLHPQMDADGTWQTRLTVAEAGAYRVFADFVHAGQARTLAADLFVDGRAGYRPLPAPAATTTTPDGYEVRLDRDDGGGAVRAGQEAELRFEVTRAGEAVHTEPYLGAGGHLVALREGDLAYLHVHPVGGEGGHDDHGDHGADDDHGAAVAFATEFPTPGRYRLYLQFRHEGRVQTAEFTQEVRR